MCKYTAKVCVGSSKLHFSTMPQYLNTGDFVYALLFDVYREGNTHRDSRLELALSYSKEKIYSITSYMIFWKGFAEIMGAFGYLANSGYDIETLNSVTERLREHVLEVMPDSQPIDL